MMMHRPFEAFCRDNFVNSIGDINNIKSDSKEAKEKRRERHCGKLTHELRVLQKNLNSLYEKSKKIRAEKGEVVEVKNIFQHSGKLRLRIASLKDEIKKAKGR